MDTFFSSLPRTKISDIIAFYLFPDNLLVAIKSSLILLVKRLKHKKRQYFKADNNPRVSFAFFFIW
ncbi:hypothetical protein E0495_05045 [Wolbachia pipientis]|uniref:Uncharacterized protein n=1 Tax=Wolbachia pipientis TaxID=955 RepID=A0A6I6CQ99_WOLPI|nr:hypothetical protein E0495_05045 [Wolbachia pipientis]